MCFKRWLELRMDIVASIAVFSVTFYVRCMRHTHLHFIAFYILGSIALKGVHFRVKSVTSHLP